MTDKTATQTAYDRVQQAACSSGHETEDGLTIYHVLHKDGILTEVTSKAQAMRVSHITAWDALAFAVNDPIKHGTEKAIEQLRMRLAQAVAS